MTPKSLGLWPKQTNWARLVPDRHSKCQVSPTPILAFVATNWLPLPIFGRNKPISAASAPSTRHHQPQVPSTVVYDAGALHRKRSVFRFFSVFEHQTVSEPLVVASVPSPTSPSSTVSVPCRASQALYRRHSHRTEALYVPCISASVALHCSRRAPLSRAPVTLAEAEELVEPWQMKTLFDTT
jgi:hypothetical protein